MIDMTPYIKAKSDQINADDLITGSMTITITNVTSCDDEQPIVICYEDNDNRVYKPCKSMRRVLVAGWGTDGKSYIGKSLTLYRDPNVKYGGIAVGGIRISHMSHIQKPLIVSLAERKGMKKAYTVAVLKTEAEKENHQKSTEHGDLIAAGDFASSNGVEAYQEWLSSLTQEQKAPIKEYHKDWVRIAKEVDNG